ncbi:MAG TPA: OB-fold domain-containing protein [Marmoricola sp.]|nr:OB-fold domain-containing protein [Marmoricola sp.]
MTETASLHAPMHVEFPYTRSLGSVLSTFMTGLANGQIMGGVLSDGRVAVPPPQFDPTTLLPITEFREVSSAGTVVTWSWVNEPLPGQPRDRPFAYALITLDGADTPLLHAVGVDSPEAMRTGMRVQVAWAPERVGAITDIAHFVPEGTDVAPTSPLGVHEAVTRLTTPVVLDYDYIASPEESSFGRGLKEGRILAQACPQCHKVYVPPRGACPTCGVPTSEPHELPDTGIVTTFCVVNVPYLGQKIKPPYVSAYVLLDGADIAFLHLILGGENFHASDVRMGMRVKAVWKPEEARTFSLENIDHFEPTGEPDADFETYKNHL